MPRIHVPIGLSSLQSGPRPSLANADTAEWETSRTTPKVETCGRMPILVDGLHPNQPPWRLTQALPLSSSCSLSSEVSGSLSLRY